MLQGSLYILVRMFWNIVIIVIDMHLFKLNTIVILYKIIDITFN